MTRPAIPAVGNLSTTPDDRGLLLDLVGMRRVVGLEVERLVALDGVGWSVHDAQQLRILQNTAAFL